MTVAISIRELSKVYPRKMGGVPFEALKGISLDVAMGETFGFIGPNGAGKSTTIKILTGGMKASRGTAHLFGIEVTDPDARAGLGYVPENPSLPDYLTPMEILLMGVNLHRLTLPNRRKHCLDCLQRFGIDHVANKVVRGFSKGMVQRTALAHALAVQPRLLILDEPLSGLDPIGRREVVDILSEYRSAGGTLFLTSHVLHDVERLADRFGLIHKGEIRAVRSPGELVGGDERVLLRTQGGTPLVGMEPEPGGRWVMDLPRSELWAALRSVETSGHVVIEVRPRLSLESAFLQAVRDDQKMRSS